LDARYGTHHDEMDLILAEKMLALYHAMIAHDQRYDNDDGCIARPLRRERHQRDRREIERHCRRFEEGR